LKIKLIQAITLTLLLVYKCDQVMPQDTGKNITQMLSSLGFENIHMIRSGDTVKLAYENNIYRWNVKGLIVILDSVVKNVQPETHIGIVTLSNGIPVFETWVMACDWVGYTNGTITKKELNDKIQSSYSTDKCWKELKEVQISNSNLFKFDFIIYPQIYIQNNYFDYIYEVQFNIAPAVEVSLWKGNSITGQVIIPIYNNEHLDKEGNYFRPGFITISQEFRLPGPIFALITAGKFDANRYGIDLGLTHPFRNPHWEISMNVGLTGWTYFSEGILTLGREIKPNWNVTASYYYSRFDMQFDLRCGRYLYGDYGVRFDCTRHFGETAIGLYAMYSGGEPNGGFHFAIPFPPGKRARRHHIRILPPRYFDWEYKAVHIIPQGQYYKSGPDENRSGDYFNLLYIKNSLH
jgi:hypothetical protein